MNPIRTRANAKQKPARRVCRQIRPVKRDLGSKNRPHIQAIPFASFANRVPKAKNATVPTEKLQTATVVVLTPIHARMCLATAGKSALRVLASARTLPPIQTVTENASRVCRTAIAARTSTVMTTVRVRGHAPTTA